MKNILLYSLLLLITIISITCKNHTYNNPVDASVALTGPTGLEVVSITETAVDLKWKMPAPDPEYPNASILLLIERSTDGTNYSVVDSADVNMTVKSIRGVYYADVQYSFRIKAKIEDRFSQSSNVVTTKYDFPAPSSCTIASMNETSALIRWVDNSAIETGFVIEQSSDRTNYTLIDSVGPDITSKSVAGRYEVGGTYSFRVKAKSMYNMTAYSNIALKTFTLNNPPAMPGNPSPADAATGVSNSPVLSWSCSDTDGDALTYDVFFGTASNPTTQIATGQSATTLSRTGLSLNTTYYWRVDAKDSKGATTTGTVWSFTTTKVIDLLMVAVAGGTFQMGSTTGNSNEQPVHSVTVGSFAIDKFEITYEKWTEVRNWALTHGYASTDIAVGRNGYSPVGSNNPVTEVNWFDILKWCNARSEKDGLNPVYYTNSSMSTVYRSGEIGLADNAVKWTANGYRLPTEAEWVFAARGGTKSNNYTYSGSNTIDIVGWYITNSGSTTHSVGQKAANELGIYDMSGNAWEWCWDWYGAYSGTAQTDPKGAGSGTYRVLRGGSFSGGDFSCRSAYRFDYDPNVRYYSFGFRCVQD